MEKIVVMALLSISLVAVVAVIGITRMNSSVPTAEATHQTGVVILGCGPASAQVNPTFRVEVYSRSSAAPALGSVVSLEDFCPQALAVLTDQGFTVAGMVSRASTLGDGFLYTLIFEDIPHDKSDD